MPWRDERKPVLPSRYMKPRFQSLIAAPLLLMACCLVAPRVYSAEAGPDFTKLAVIAPGADLAAAARAHNIPLSGLDPPGEPGQLNPGDSFTAIVTLCEKGGRRTQWLLYLSAIEPDPKEPPAKPPEPEVLYSGRGNRFEFASSPARVRLETLGPFALAGSKPAKSRDQTAAFGIDKGFLSLGLDRAAATIWRREQTPVKGSFWFGPTPPNATQAAEGRRFADGLALTLDEERAMAGAFPALFSYFDVIEHTEGLEEIMLRVIQKPSIWSLIGHLGVRANLLIDSKHFAPADARAWAVPGGPPAYDFPMQLQLNDQLALRVTFVVTSPRPPLLTCGGIIGMLAEKPGDPQTYLTLRVVSARSAAHQKILPGSAAASQ